MRIEHESIQNKKSRDYGWVRDSCAVLSLKGSGLWVFFRGAYLFFELCVSGLSKYITYNADHGGTVTEGSLIGQWWVIDRSELG